MKHKSLIVVLTIIIALITSVSVVLASGGYTAIISVINSGSTLGYSPVILSLDNSYLSSLGYISPTGTDVKITESGASLPIMLTTDKTVFVPSSLVGSATSSFAWSSGNTPASFALIPGYNGSIYTASDAALDPGKTFIVDMNGYLMATAPTNIYITGTATFTQNSAAVTGADGASWTQSMVGEQIKPNADSQWYTIASVTNATHLTMSTNYAIATATSVAYTINSLAYQFDYQPSWSEGGCLQVYASATNTIYVVYGTGNNTVTTSGTIASGLHDIVIQGDGTTLFLKSGGSTINSVDFGAANIFTANNILWNPGNGFAYLTSIKYTVGTTEEINYASPTTMLSPLTASSANSYPRIISSNSGTNAVGTSHTVNLPSSLGGGNLLLVLFATNSNPSLTLPSGWTQLFNYTTANGSLACLYKVASGSEGASIAVTTSASVTSSYQSFQIVNYQGIPVAGSASSGSATTNPNPPSLTSGFGAVNTLWLAMAEDDVNITAYPTNYTGNGVTGTAPYLASGYYTTSAATEDPDVFTAASGNWVANTIGIEVANPYTVVNLDSGGSYSGVLTLGYNYAVGASIGSLSPSTSGVPTTAVTTTPPDIGYVPYNQGGQVTNYTTGTATFTNSSTAVTGSGTTWTSAMNGGYIELNADATYVQIASVGSTTSLTLTGNYTSAGGTGAYTMQYLTGGQSSEDTQQTNNIWTPFWQPFTQVSKYIPGMNDIPIILIALIIGTAAMIFVVVWVLKHTQNQFLGLFVMVIFEAGLYALGIYQLWFVIVTATVGVALLVFERKPSL